MGTPTDAAQHRHQKVPATSAVRLNSGIAHQFLICFPGCRRMARRLRELGCQKRKDLPLLSARCSIHSDVCGSAAVGGGLMGSLTMMIFILVSLGVVEGNSRIKSQAAANLLPRRTRISSYICRCFQGQESEPMADFGHCLAGG